MPRPDQLDNMATLALNAGYEAVFKGMYTPEVEHSSNPDDGFPLRVPAVDPAGASDD